MRRRMKKCGSHDACEGANFVSSCMFHQDIILRLAVSCLRQNSGQALCSTLLNRLWMKYFLGGPALIETKSPRSWHDLRAISQVLA
jgi:hypothetical protein